MRSPLISFIRRILLPPESRQELFLRTLYHRLNANPFFVNRQMHKAAASYLEWREKQSESLHTPTPNLELTLGVTFLMEVAAGDEPAALATLRSLQSMASPKWHLMPVAAAGVVLDLVISDQGTENRLLTPVTINRITQELLKVTNDDFVVFCQAGDVFSTTLLDEFAIAFGSTPSADVIYTDCEYPNPTTGKPSPFFKPSALSPELMLSVNYLSRGFTRIDSLAGFTPSHTGLMSLEYYLHLRLVNSSIVTHHIPRVLLKTSRLSSLNDGEHQNLSKTHLEQGGFEKVVVQSGGAQSRVNWDFGATSVSLIILSHDHGEWLRNLVDSIFALTEYVHYSLVIVDNRSTEPELLAYYKELSINDRVTIVQYDQPFNYSEAINIGVAHSNADVVVLLNNDMLVIDPGWLSELVQWAMHPGIGVVGGKLLHRDQTIQHAGIILGINGFIGHLYLNAPEHYHGLAGSVDWYRNLYAVTGACQAVRRELFHQVGGYDERFGLAFGDIDFCLRVVKAGYRNLYNPFARLTHFEGGSRGYETPVEDILLAYDELLPWLVKDDPHFSPNLTYRPIPTCNLSQSGVDERLRNIENRKSSLIKSG